MTGPAPLAMELHPGSVVLSARAVALCRAGLVAAIDEQRRRGLTLPGDAVLLLSQLTAALIPSVPSARRTAAGPSDPSSRVRTSAAGLLLAPDPLPAAPSAPEMTAADAASALDVKPRQVRRLIADGVLTGQKAGPLWMVSAESVQAHRERRRASG